VPAFRLLVTSSALCMTERASPSNLE
jgi:hypothetical protein